MCSALQFLAKSFNDDITVSLLFGSELLLLQSAQRGERDEEIRDEGINCLKKRFSGGFLTPAANLVQFVGKAVQHSVVKAKLPVRLMQVCFKGKSRIWTFPHSQQLWTVDTKDICPFFVKRLSIFHSHADNVSKDTKETGKNATETHHGKKKINLSLVDILSGQHPNKLRFQVLEKFFFQQRSLHIWSERRPPFV